MRILIVGLGVQGYKRRDFANADYVASVDPVNKEADYKNIQDVSLDDFDGALCCVPDAPKAQLARYLLSHGKHMLIEKPLWAESDKDLKELQSMANQNNAVCYTAYNHRFEPHFITMRDLIKSGELGKIYSCRMFYGNGTASLVKESHWRDKGAGVLPDLGSHLLDTANFWFDIDREDFLLHSCNNFENESPDHVIIASELTLPRLEFEMTLLSWRNHFTCDVYAEKGSAHISSLCKWGPSTFVHRKRVYPSGVPEEDVVTLEQADPTWEAEYIHFKKLCETKTNTDLTNDIWINRTIRNLSDIAVGKK